MGIYSEPEVPIHKGRKGQRFWAGSQLYHLNSSESSRKDRAGAKVFLQEKGTHSGSFFLFYCVMVLLEVHLFGAEFL